MPSSGVTLPFNISRLRWAFPSLSLHELDLAINSLGTRRLVTTDGPGLWRTDAEAPSLGPVDAKIN